MDRQTAEALIRLVVPIIAAVAAVFGWQVDVNAIVVILVALFAVVSAFYGWYWKNNPWTKAAKQGQEVIDMLKDGTLDDVLVYRFNDGTIQLDLIATDDPDEKVGGTE